MFRVYPNPTNGNFMVGFADPGEKGTFRMEIFRMQGEKLIAKEMTGKGFQEIDLTDRSTGVYFVRLISGNNTETVKLIKN
jgi:hypothetical protein